jgi:hypothetical protein
MRADHAASPIMIDDLSRVQCLRLIWRHSKARFDHAVVLAFGSLVLAPAFLLMGALGLPVAVMIMAGAALHLTFSYRRLFRANISLDASYERRPSWQ